VQFVAQAYGNQQQEQLVIKCSVLLLTQPSTAQTTFLYLTINKNVGPVAQLV